MVLIDITSILSQDLTSRKSVRRLVRAIPTGTDVIFDFRNAKFLNEGIDVVFREDMHILAAVIDRRILWYGNINFTGGNYPDDNTMRIIEPAIASKVMGYLMEGE